MTTPLDRLEKRFGNYAIPNLTMVLLLGQILVWLLEIFAGFPRTRLMLAPSLVFAGEWWRVVTFLFVPKVSGVTIWALFAFYIFYLCGSTLENAWGHFRYNCFIFLGALFTVVFTLLGGLLFSPLWLGTPVASNIFLLTSIFIAFAILNPNYEFLIFFVLPVKVKWLAWLSVFYWLLTLATKPWMDKLCVLAVLLNLGLFFGREWVGARKMRARATAYRQQSRAQAAEPFHRCSVCGATDASDPDLRFAYKDGDGYCERHWDQMEEQTQP